MTEGQSGLRIDLGCGPYKKEGTLGIDMQPLPGVNLVLDIEKEPLPFEDGSVVYVHSSHFLEHTANPGRLFAEISRVCAHNARLELWTPYAWSNSGFTLDHKSFFTEDMYLHMCVWYVDFWKGILHARWILNEFHYVVEPKTLCYLKKHKISLDFGLRHLHNVAKEFCAYITVVRNDLSASSPPIRRTFSTRRFARRYEIKGAEPFDEAICKVEKVVSTFAKGDPLPPVW